MRWRAMTCGLLLWAGAGQAALRLIPQPVETVIGEGVCPVAELRIVLADPGDDDNRFAAELLQETLAECGLRAVEVGGTPVYLVTAGDGKPGMDWLVAANAVPGPDLGDEGYRLVVRPDRIVLAGRTAAGTFYATQTLRQLIRANRDTADAIPAVSITDYPAFAHRGFTDDISRGPFPTVDEMRRIIATAAELKLNCLNWYVEHVFQIPKHPVICPPGIGLSRELLAELESYAKRYHVELIGGFQSFGHFWNILKHDEYKHLRETGGILSPAFEESYRLLADIYDAIAPSFHSPLFNINCDETYGLGEGPAKSLVEQEGLGAVYAGHVRRVHELLAAHGKRVMMWGDIVLQHPEQLATLPKDIIMLSWGYGAAPTFERAIVPFKESGFEFWVCPGVSCWSRMLPDHVVAMVNIQNYLRDGARLGASGVLNTTWDDDGENLFEANWHNLAWGAQCSWRPLDSDPDSFEASFGPCFYGVPGAGEATVAMTPAFGMAAYGGLSDTAFWTDPFTGPVESPERVEAGDRRLLACVREALAALTATPPRRHEPAWLAHRFALARIEALALARLERIEAGRRYAEAANGLLAEAQPKLAEAQRVLTTTRQRLRDLREAYQQRWLAENEPYWLDQILRRWDAQIGRYDRVIERLDEVGAEAAQGQPLPAPEELGLGIVADLSRLTPQRRGPVTATAEWQVERAVARLPLELRPHGPARPFYVAELSLSAAGLAGLNDDPARYTVVVVRTADGAHVGPGQLWRAADGSLRLACEIPGPLTENASLALTAYLVTDSAPPAVTVSEAAELPGGLWLENGEVRLLFGPQGAHLFRWQVRAAADLDLTDPGDSDYHGFLDDGAGRTTPYRLEIVTTGPLFARVRAVFEADREKVVTLYRDRPVVEVLTAPGSGFFWCYDAVANMAADSTTPGQVLFSTGFAAPVPAAAEQVQHRQEAVWSAKHRADGLTLALLTPDGRTAHRAGPGGGWGGVGIEGARPQTHFVIYGGVLGDDRAAVLDGLAAAFARPDQPTAVVGEWELRHR